MEKFIGKKVKVEYTQETGWKRPVTLTFNNHSYKVEKIERRWEEHTLGDPWWQRKHRVWYGILLEDGNYYQIYWDRGASGKGKHWFLVKKVS